MAGGNAAGASGTEIRRCPPEGAVRRLLGEVGLPADDITPAHLEHFFGCWTAGELDGIVGLEMGGEVALLRSLAVRRDREGLGIGPALLAHAERHAAERGARSVYLLTTTAQEYFRLLGYAPLPREEAPTAIRTTREYASICPANATLMVKRLGAGAKGC